MLDPGNIPFIPECPEEAGIVEREYAHNEPREETHYRINGWNMTIKSSYNSYSNMWRIERINLSDVPDSKKSWVLAHLVEPLDHMLTVLGEKHNFEIPGHWDRDIVWSGHKDEVRL